MPIYSQENEFHPGYLAGQLYPLHTGVINVSTAGAHHSFIALPGPAGDVL